MRSPFKRRWPWIALAGVGVVALGWNPAAEGIASYINSDLSDRDAYSSVYALPVSLLSLLVAVIGLTFQSKQARRVEKEALISADQPRAGMTSLAVPGLVGADQIRGRDRVIGELVHLYERNADPALRVHVLHGMGGVGKTAIAQHVAKVLRQRGITVWFISAAEASSLHSGMRELAMSLGASSYELDREWTHNAPDVLWRRLKAYSRRWLIVIDNADDLSALAPVNQTVAQRNGWIRPTGTRNGAIIVTSRDGTKSSWGNWCRMHQIGILPVADSAQMLIDIAGSNCGSKEQAADLAGRLGGLPLALHLAGRYLADARLVPVSGQITTFTDYHAALDRHGVSAVFPDGNGVMTVARAISVIAETWELSLTSMERGGRYKARNLLRLLSTMADAEIPYHVLLDPSEMATSDMFRGLTPGRLRELLQSLSSFGLIELKVDGEVPMATATRDLPLGTLSLHPLIRDVSRHHLRVGGNMGAAIEVAARLLHRAAIRYDDHTEPKNWPVLKLLAPHPLHLLTLAAAESDLRAEVTSDLTQAASMITRYMAAIGLYAAAVSEAKLIRDLAVGILGEEHPDILQVSADIASFTGGTGDVHSARELYAGLVLVSDRVLGAEREESLMYRSNLAFFTGVAGDPAAARSQCLKLLPVASRAIGVEGNAARAIRRNLALFSAELGDFEAAQHQIEALNRFYGNNEDFSMIVFRVRFACRIGRSGDYSSARDQLVELLPTLRKVLG
ncbi:NB-ARC domain-containing protein, partial [Micromonospora sp. LOL_014]|uniref:NB-ARC domain-containing protein n=1 Tax=Micromonospora sp. LOL_014 TaxID=3345415 RepID=UPI003A84C22B